MKYKLLMLATYICYSTALLLPFSSAHAKNFTTGDIDPNVSATWLMMDSSTSKYNIHAQWPVTNMNQWRKVLEHFDTTPESDLFYNPILAKDPSIVTFVQTNPDKISGETIFFSEHGPVLRIKKTPVDTNFEKAEDLYNFLNKEIETNNAGYSTETQKIPIDHEGIVVVYLGSNTLGNPNWVISDPKKIEAYKDHISEMIGVTVATKGQAQLQSKLDHDFTGLNIFLVYTNYPEALGKMLIVRNDGRARWTKIVQTIHNYPDTQHFYDIFKEQAEEIIFNNKQSEKAQHQYEMEKGF